jgi:hypothetical protein
MARCPTITASPANGTRILAPGPMLASRAVPLAAHPRSRRRRAAPTGTPQELGRVEI